MNDTPPLTPLTDHALIRLRRLADGNGMAPEAIELIGTEEKIYELEGTLTLTPHTEVQTGRYAGLPQGKGRKVLSSYTALHAETESRQQAIKSAHDWVEPALHELKADASQGWGLEGAHVTLPDKAVILAASEACPVCHGQKLLTCPQCNGQRQVTCMQCRGTRQETCPTCGGTGHSLQNPDQRCPTCNGIRFVTCRICHGVGQTACPTCQGQGGTACSNCRGLGQMTEEAAITFSAETHFKLEQTVLPSGLRRGLDRLGIHNLTKGHADIEVVKPKPEPDADPAHGAHKSGEDAKQKVIPPVLHYRAKLPYADIKMRFNGGRAVLFSVFGKKSALLGVPAFLDEALQPARDALKQTAQNGGPLDEALKMRAMREALALELEGKNTVRDLRRIYHVGLSPVTAEEILGNLRLVLKHYTRHIRIGVAIGLGILSAVLFGGIFMTDLHATLTAAMTWPIVLIIDLLVLNTVMALSAFVLSLSTRFVLRRRFPDATVSLRQKIGAVGYGLMAIIMVIFVIILALAPLKPLWLLRLFH